MSDPEKPIAVIGGGLTGLVAAFTLRHTPPRPHVILFEGDNRLGGKIKTTNCAGVTIEAGADSFLARDPVVVDLCTELGIAEELVRPAVFGAQIVSRGSLHPLPPGFLRGVPPSVAAARAASILSAPGAWRTAADLLWPARLTGPDVSFGSFVRRRFGKQVLERLVSAVMSGTRAGDPYEVSLAAGAPELDSIARRHRSVMRGLQQVREHGDLESGAPPFRSLRPGLSRLVERLVDHLGSVEVRLGQRVDRLEREGGDWNVVTGSARTPVAGAIVATPGRQSAGIIESFAPEAARRLAAIRYSSSVSITLIYPRGRVELPDGSGLLVPVHERRFLSACTWFSRKWPHHAPADGSEVVRAFVGGTTETASMTDKEIVSAAHTELSGLVTIYAEPIAASVERWSDSLPQYAVGHLELVDDIERELAAAPIRLAGAGLRGSGIPDCVEQGRRAASSLLDATVGSPA